VSGIALRRKDGEGAGDPRWSERRSVVVRW